MRGQFSKKLVLNGRLLLCSSRFGRAGRLWFAVFVGWFLEVVEVQRAHGGSAHQEMKVVGQHYAGVSQQTLSRLGAPRDSRTVLGGLHARTTVVRASRGLQQPLLSSLA